MSSVKRTNVVSSELGQLKASDKWETTSKTISTSTTNTSDIPSDTMSSTSNTKTQLQQQQLQQQQSRDAQKSTNSTQQDTKVISFRQIFIIIIKTKTH